MTDSDAMFPVNLELVKQLWLPNIYIYNLRTFKVIYKCENLLVRCQTLKVKATSLKYQKKLVSSSLDPNIVWAIKPLIWWFNIFNMISDIQRVKYRIIIRWCRRNFYQFNIKETSYKFVIVYIPTSATIGVLKWKVPSF